MWDSEQKMPKVSLIVPVYKTETTLAECLDSLLNQTLKDIEIILVDDGSPDEAGNICDTYMDDARVKVIHKENGGLSSARNVGLHVAQGEYIGFVDSDDFVEYSMFEKMYNAIENTKADVCLCAYFTVDEKGNKKEHPFVNMPSEMTAEQIKDYLILPLIGPDMSKGSKALEGFVCRNLYKHSVICDETFLSEREYFAEDIMFNLTAYKKCKKICCINECLYYYRYVAESLSNRYRWNVEKMFENLLMFEKSYMISNELQESMKRLYSTGVKFLLVSIKNLKKKDCNLTKQEKILAIKNILSTSIYQESLNNIDETRYSWKMFGFIALCKTRQARILLWLS